MQTHLSLALALWSFCESEYKSHRVHQGQCIFHTYRFLSASQGHRHIQQATQSWSEWGVCNERMRERVVKE